jgi:hypothetical protein
MMNSMELKRERERENKDNDLRGSAMCLLSQGEYDYNLLFNVLLSMP